MTGRTGLAWGLVVAAIAPASLVGCSAEVTEAPGPPGGGGAGGAGEGDCPVCPPGYTPVGTECVWYGGPSNGDFASADAWIIEGAVEIDPTNPGFGGPGVARFTDVCEHGLLRQTFEMPTFACSEPLRLSLAAVNSCDVCNDGAHMLVDINGGRHQLDLAIVTENAGACLGERAFGGMVEIALEARADNCFGAFEALLDDVDVQAAAPAWEPPPPPPEEPLVPCPAPGTIVNGNFEDGLLGWTTESATIASEFGIGGTTGARLSSAECAFSSVVGMASLPMHESLPQPAIELWAQGQSFHGVDVSYGTHVLGRLPNADQSTLRVCIPRWAQGIAEPVGFAITGSFNPFPCPEDDYRIDNLALVSEPACGDSGWIFDGDFEAAASGSALASAWSLQGSAVIGTTDAHSGATALMLESDPKAQCLQVNAFQDITIPAGAPRPAVRFWYRTGALAATTAPYADGQALPPSPRWTEHQSCLPPQRADAPHRFLLELRQGPSCSAGERVYFDSFEVLADSDCE